MRCISVWGGLMWNASSAEQDACMRGEVGCVERQSFGPHGPMWWGQEGNLGVRKMVITFSLHITNHIFSQHHQVLQIYLFWLSTPWTNTCTKREALWLLSLSISLWLLSDDGCTTLSIFNSFVFNLRFISSIPLYLQPKVKPNYQWITKVSLVPTTDANIQLY